MRWKRIVEKTAPFADWVGTAAAVGVAAFAILWSIQYATPQLLDWDIYYHLKFAQITSQNGIIRQFPWCQFSLFKDHFADKECLYHLLLVPFVRYDLVAAGKLFPVYFGALIVVVLFLILRYYKALYPWLWLVLFCTWTPTFLYRFCLPRPHLLAILAFVMMAHALMAEKRLLLFAVACFYPVTHSMAVLIWVLPVMYELNRWRIERRFEWKTIWVVLAGLAVGFVAHPNFPNNIRVLWIQAVSIPWMLWFGKNLNFGMEFTPFDTRRFLLESYLPLGLNAVAIFLSLTRRYDLDRKIGFVLALNLVCFAVTMLSKRFVEFFVPINVLFLALVFTRYITAESLEAIGARLGVRRVLGAALLVSGGLVLSAYHHYRVIVEVVRNNRPANYRQAAMWLLENTKPGEIVFTADWDDMPQLFFFNDKNYYLNVLDPAFMYCWSPKVWQEWREIVAGMNSNTYRAIREDFRSRYVFATADMRPFLGTLMRDPRFELVHKDRGCGVFRLRDEPFDYFVTKWSVAGPYPLEEADRLAKLAGRERDIFRLGHSDKSTTLPIRFEPCTTTAVRYGFVDLCEQFRGTTRPLTRVCAFARATIESPTSGPVLLHLGFDDGAMAWLNDEVVFHDVQPSSAQPDEHVVEARLRPGTNVLDIRILQLDREWGLYCWIGDKDRAKTLVQNGKGGVWKNGPVPRPPTEPKSPPSPPAERAAIASPSGP